MSSGPESAGSEEIIPKSSGRRNPRRSARNAIAIKSDESTEVVSKRTRKRADSHSSDSEPHQTRSKSTRARKKSGSPSFRSSRRSTNEETQESPAARVKSSRRASSRINYKESEGEEDATNEVIGNEEEEYDIDDDWEESDEEKKKREVAARKAPKSRKSSTNSTKESRSKGRSKARQTPAKRPERSSRRKKKIDIEEEEEESEEIDEESKDEEEPTKAKEDIVKDEEKMDLDDQVDAKSKKQDAIDDHKNDVEVKDNQESKNNSTETKESSSLMDQDSNEKNPIKRKSSEEPLVDAPKKTKLDSLSEVKENPAYLRKSPVIVENKQFIESNKDFPTEVQPVIQSEISPNMHKNPETTPSILNVNGLTNEPKESTENLIYNPSLSMEKRESLKGITFNLMAYNSADASKQVPMVEDLKRYSSDIICLQSLPLSFYKEKLEPHIKPLGYSEVIDDGLITIYKTSKFELISNLAISLQNVVGKDLEDKPSEIAEATKTILNDCYGKVQIVKLQFVPGNMHLQLCNLALPTQLDPSSSTLLMCRLLQAVDSSPDKPLVLCGQLSDTKWVTQLLESGKLSEEISKEMIKRKDITTLQNQEPKSLIELLPSLYECPDRNYSNCVTTVMGPQLGPSKPVQLWISKLQTIGVSSPSATLASIAFAN